MIAVSQATPGLFYYIRFMASFPHPVPTEGWLLYDDSCGFCRGVIGLGKPLLLRLGYDYAPLQSDWVHGHFGMPSSELLRDVRLLLPNGSNFVGADVYRHIMQRLWWAYPIYLLSCLPSMRQLFDLLYRMIASNRQLVSKACRLNSPKPSKP
jgi:predicted DCC family thiol-disulfide oxidoreductase YuxK